MNAISPIFAVAIAMGITSCASISRADIPNIVPYGATERVAASAEGSGYDAMGGLTMTPLSESWDPAELPLLQKPKVAIWYHYPITATDKMSRCGATIMYVIYDTVVWGDEEAERKGSQKLGAITDLRNGSEGLTFATTAIPDRFTSGMQSIGRSYRLPYAQGGAVQPTTLAPSGTQPRPPVYAPPPVSSSPPLRTTPSVKPPAASTQPASGE